LDYSGHSFWFNRSGLIHRYIKIIFKFNKLIKLVLDLLVIRQQIRKKDAGATGKGIIHAGSIARDGGL
jgi:hypothetical protein